MDYRMVLSPCPTLPLASLEAKVTMLLCSWRCCFFAPPLLSSAPATHCQPSWQLPEQLALFNNSSLSDTAQTSPAPQDLATSRNSAAARTAPPRASLPTHQSVTTALTFRRLLIPLQDARQQAGRRVPWSAAPSARLPTPPHPSGTSGGLQSVLPRHPRLGRHPWHARGDLRRLLGRHDGGDRRGHRTPGTDGARQPAAPDRARHASARLATGGHPPRSGQQRLKRHEEAARTWRAGGYRCRRGWYADSEPGWKHIARRCSPSSTSRAACATRWTATPASVPVPLRQSWSLWTT
ncbi:hypothetical protein GQ53DRAFT_118456 [Thozetella sp. PMI_491]|nr:hypothetical protein GQ53DRAFT_118456 [Thozetella sp. PMI_491]